MDRIESKLALQAKEKREASQENAKTGHAEAQPQSGQVARLNTRVIDNTDIVREAMLPTVTHSLSFLTGKQKPPK
jgi:hypothetical protein